MKFSPHIQVCGAPLRGDLRRRSSLGRATKGLALGTRQPWPGVVGCRLLGGEEIPSDRFFLVQFWGMMILVEMFLDKICEIQKMTFLEKGKELERDDSLQTTTYHP